MRNATSLLRVFLPVLLLLLAVATPLLAQEAPDAAGTVAEAVEAVADEPTLDSGNTAWMMI